MNTKFSSRCFVAWYSADGVFQHVSMLPGAHNRGYLATINGRLLLALNGLTATIVGPDSTLTTSELGVALVEFDSSGNAVDSKMLLTYSGNVGLGGFSLSEAGIQITGGFTGDLTLGSGANQLELLRGPARMLVASYDPAGQLLWGKTTEQASGSALAADPILPGGAIVIGRYSGPTVFGEGEEEETTITPVATSGMFVARYKPSGDLDWVRSPSSEGLTNAFYELAVGEFGQIAVSGVYNTRATFGEGEANQTRLTGRQGNGFTAVFAP
ncbi:MAG: hypothetical protein JKY56_14460 [Kofleriaceae bacterium]|nr:hypothetical protein [Kofleriaceae bacterium]